jgi:GntR family transcriptional regulator
MELSIITGSQVPIYRQIKDQICQAIANRTLKEGEKLPSIRSLADQLVLNHNTVAKAYHELVKDGVIESRHGRGAFVLQQRKVFNKAERSRRLKQVLDLLISEAILLNCTPEEVREEVEKSLEQLHTQSGK